MSAITNTVGKGLPVTEAMLAQIRLLAVDIDGTLLTSDHRVLLAVTQAFGEARAAGLSVVLASARSPSALKPILVDLGHGGPCICFSGAWLGTIEPGSADSVADISHTIRREAAIAVTDAAHAAELVPSWHTADQWLVTRMSPSVEREMRVTGQTPTLVDDFREAPLPNKILLIGDRTVLLGLRNELTRVHDTEFDSAFSHSTYLEIVPKGADKLTALMQLAGSRGIESRQISAVGDAENDLRMIRSVGFGVAMGNATPEVRSGARWITATNDEGGVAALIRKLLAARRNQ